MAEQDRSDQSDRLQDYINLLGGAGAAKGAAALAANQAALMLLLRQGSIFSNGRNTYDIVNPETLKNVGVMSSTYNPNTKNVQVHDLITNQFSPYQKGSMPREVNDASHALGYKDIKSLFGSIKENYPEAQTASGLRISGARLWSPRYLNDTRRNDYATYKLPDPPNYPLQQGVLPTPPAGFGSKLNDSVNVVNFLTKKNKL